MRAARDGLHCAATCARVRLAASARVRAAACTEIRAAACGAIIATLGAVACVAPPRELAPEAGAPPDATALRGEPVLTLVWDPAFPPEGEAPPALVDFRGGHGASFGTPGPSYHELPPEEVELMRFAGGFTLEAELVLVGRPGHRAAIISGWQTADGKRAFELGVDRDQQLYLAVSGDGLGGDSIAEVTGTRQLRFGEAQLVTAVFDPRRAMVIRQNGMETGRLSSGVPSRVFPAEVPVWVGCRSDGLPALALEAVVGRIDFFDRALPQEASSAWAQVRDLGEEPAPFAPARAITSGPGFHWFGYYDKHQFDPTGSLVLGQRSAFELRLPGSGDAITIGMVDLSAGDLWIPLGESRAWSWQQGCMLQWLPGSDTEIIYNDRQDTGNWDSAPLVSRILDVVSREERSLPRPIYHVSPRGDEALGTDFFRLGETYGYPPLSDTTRDPAPEDSTLYRMDLETGASQDLFTVAEIAAQVGPDSWRHVLTHIQWNPSGTRFLFYHRYADSGGGHTRVLTANPDGTGLFLLASELALSHYTWLDDETTLIWSGARGGYAWFKDGIGYVGTLFAHGDGHQTFLPPMIPPPPAPGDAQVTWLLADTYPDQAGYVTPFLYNLLTDELVILGRFHHPWSYGGGAHRVDAHPRLDRQGRRVVIDSPQEGGRQMHMIDLSGITGQ